MGKPWDPGNYSPPIGALLLSAAWPILLFITTEVMFWKGWSQGRLWTLVRCVSMVLVAAPVANASYHHLSGLYRHFFPDDRLTVWFGPLAIDGATLMCTAALQSRAHRLRAEQHAPADAPPVMSPSLGQLTGEHAGPPSEPDSEATLTDTSAVGLTGEVTRPVPVSPNPLPLTDLAGAPPPPSPQASPVFGVGLTGESSGEAGELTGEPDMFTAATSGSPAGSEEAEKPSDEEITAEARRLRPEGPYSGNWLVKTFGIGTPRATRLLNQLVPDLVAATATQLADDPREPDPVAPELQPL